MSDSLGGLGSVVADLNKSVEAAIKRVQAQQQQSTAPVQEFQKTVRKSAVNTAFQATDIGILARETTRLNVVSTLAEKDTADFYKFKVTSKGEAAIGQVGDEGVRVQVQSRLGVVVADSDKESGANYESFQKLQAGALTLDRGDYVLRVSREKGTPDTEAKNYALQLNMGGYTKDFDTIAKQPAKGESPYQLSEGQKAMLNGLTSASQSLASIPSGQSGTQKLLGSFYSSVV